MLFRRLLTIICPILMFVGLELTFYKIELIYYLVPLLVLILLVTLKSVSRLRLFSLDFWQFFLLPFLLFLSLTSILFIISSAFFMHFLMVIFSVTIFLYLENVFLFFYRPTQYQAFSFENFSAFLNFSIFFLTAIDLNALNIFLNVPFWLISLILVAVTSLLLMQSFWVNKIKSKIRLANLLITNLIVLEFFWCINFLPGNFYVDSAILSLIYYYVYEIINAQLLNKLEKKIIWRFTILAIILIALVTLTSRWI